MKAIAVFLVVACVVDAELLSTSDFEQQIDSIANTGLGVEFMQNVINSDVTFTETSLDGAALISQLRSALSAKFSSRFQLVRALKDKVEQTYADFYVLPPDDECCHLEPSEEYDPRLKGYVYFDKMCMRIPYDAVEEASRKYATGALLQQFQQNMEDVPGVKYQFFGSEQGLLFSYPAAPTWDCTWYDPRNRPWYVNTATPFAKDVVLVIDVSGSMVLTEGDSWWTRLDLAKGAAVAVLDSLTPLDRVGVVTFSTQAHAYGGSEETSDCYSTQLAKATELSKWALMDYVLGLAAQGQTYYSRGLYRAFQMFINSDNLDPNRKKVILFLTDGDPSSTDIAHIVPTIQDAEAQLNNSVTVLAFGIGGVSSSGEAILDSIVTTSQSQPGTVTMLTDASLIRREMSSYYNFFARPEFYDPIIALPYFDFFGLGLITTVSLPVYVSGSFVGVVGVDISLADLFEEVDYFVQDAQTYAFVVHQNGIVLTHPLIPQPANVHSVPVHTHINVLEQTADMRTQIQYMLGGQEGSSSVVNAVTLAKGNAVTEGVKVVEYNATFYWLQVNETSLAVGLVLGASSTQRTAALTTLPSNIPFTYHDFSLHATPPSTCAHFLREAVSGDSVVKFGPQAFLEPFTYLDQEEQAGALVLYKDILGGAQDNTVFKSGVKESIAITGRIHEQWFQGVAVTTIAYAVWRYVGLSNGVLRLTPGTHLEKYYDPVLRSWYKRSVAFAGTHVISAPYLDAFGAGYVITLSHTLTSPGNTSALNGTHALENIMGVMAVDFTVNYFYYVMMTSFPTCSESDYSCFMIDSAGYIIVHPDFITIAGTESPLVENVHITIKEPVIANSLISNGHMVKKSCVFVYNITRQHHYEVTATGLVTNSDSPFYEMTRLPGTNAFVVLHQFDTASPDCACSDERSLEPPECSGTFSASSCPCPCHSPAEYEWCQALFTVNDTWLDWSVCPPMAPTEDLIIEEEDRENLELLDQCYAYDCRAQESQFECFILPQCNFCVLDEDGSQLEAPFCDEAEVCYFGQIGFQSPYSYRQGGDILSVALDRIFRLLKIGGIAVVAVVIIVIVACCCINSKKKRRRQQAVLDIPHNGGFEFHWPPWLSGVLRAIGVGISCICASAFFWLYYRYRKKRRGQPHTLGPTVAQAQEEERRRQNELLGHTGPLTTGSKFTQGGSHPGIVIRPLESEIRSGSLHLRYTCVTDQYMRLSDDSRISPGWKSYAYKAENIRRFEDYNMKAAFLARETAAQGVLSWRFDCTGHAVYVHKAEVEAHSHNMDFGVVAVDVLCNDQPHSQLPPGGNKSTIVLASCVSLTIVAHLKGGLGSDPGKNTRLFQQAMNDVNSHCFDVKLYFKPLAHQPAPLPHPGFAPAPAGYGPGHHHTQVTGHPPASPFQPQPLHHSTPTAGYVQYQPPMHMPQPGGY